jgi:hypothetical protein
MDGIDAHRSALDQYGGRRIEDFKIWPSLQCGCSPMFEYFWSIFHGKSHQNGHVGSLYLSMFNCSQGVCARMFPVEWLSAYKGPADLREWLDHCPQVANPTLSCLRF